MSDVKNVTAYAKGRMKFFYGHCHLGHCHWPLSNRLDLSQNEGCNPTMPVAVPALIARIDDLLVIHGEEATKLSRHGGMVKRAKAHAMTIANEVWLDHAGHKCFRLRVQDHGELRCDVIGTEGEGGLTLKRKKWQAGDWQHKVYKYFRIPRSAPST